MLKKLKKLLFVFFCVLGLSFTMIPNAKAFYPEKLYGDPNYVMASAHMGTAWYVRRDSLTKDLVKPPYYQYTIEVIYACANMEDMHSATEKEWRMEEKKRYTMTFYYENDLDGMYLVKEDGSLRYIDLNGPWAENGYLDGVGRAVWELGKQN